MNNCTFIGRLSKDPEMRYTQQGTAIARFSLAVDRKTKEKQTDFFDIEVWGKTAEFVEKYFHKGMRVAVRGEMRTNTYTDKEGTKRKAYVLSTIDVEFADGKQNAGAAQADADGFEVADGELPFV